MRASRRRLRWRSRRMSGKNDQISVAATSSMVSKDSLPVEEEDFSDLVPWIEKINRRGHAGLFAQEGREDRRIVELSAAEEWSRATFAKYGISARNIRSNPDDPPDCFADVVGKTISIEMTELIDGQILARIKHKSRQGQSVTSGGGSLFADAQWTKERLATGLAELIQNKATKLKKHPVDCLVIYSGEPWLSAPDVENWLSTLTFKKPATISAAYLLLEYSPGYSNQWPVFRLL